MKRINHECRKSGYFLFVFTVLITQFHAIGFAQQTKPKSEAEIRVLVKNVSDKDSNIAGEARKTLVNIGADSIPIFINLAKKGDTCERFAAAQMIFVFELRNREVVLPLADIVASDSAPSNSQEEANCRRGAAQLLGFSGDGIRALTRLVKNKNLFVRHTAISVFGNMGQGGAEEDRVNALIEAIPAIASAAREKDERIKNTAYKVLGNFSNDETELGRLAKTELNKLPK